MGRSASAIQAEITELEAYLASSDSLVASAGSDGTSLSRANRESLQKRLDQLYAQLDRVNGTAPMLVRGRIKGL